MKKTAWEMLVGRVEDMSWTPTYPVPPPQTPQKINRINIKSNLHVPTSDQQGDHSKNLDQQQNRHDVHKYNLDV